jgi:hypothetical protein
MEPAALDGVMAGLHHVADVLAGPAEPAAGVAAPALVTAGRTRGALVCLPQVVAGPGALREMA